MQKLSGSTYDLAPHQPNDDISQIHLAFNAMHEAVQLTDVTLALPQADDGEAMPENLKLKAHKPFLAAVVPHLRHTGSLLCGMSESESGTYKFYGSTFGACKAFFRSFRS